MTYAYDPELVPWIPMIPHLSIADVQKVRREEAELFGNVPAYEPPVPVETRDLTVPGPQDALGPVRVFRPTAALLPGLIYIHGGGFVLGSVDLYRDDATAIAAEVGAVVVSVEYRLAPSIPSRPGLRTATPR